MFNAIKDMWRKAIWIPYEKIWEYPTAQKIRAAIAAYCTDAGWSYEFISENKVKIENEIYHIWHGQSHANWGGGYGIKLLKLYKKEQQRFLNKIS